MSKLLPSILIIDEDNVVISTLTNILKAEFDIYSTSVIDEALLILKKEWIQIIIYSESILIEQNTYFFTSLNKQWPEIVKILTVKNKRNFKLPDILKQYDFYQYITQPFDDIDIKIKLNTANSWFKLTREIERINIELKLQPKNLKTAIEAQRNVLSAHFNWETIVRSPDSCMNNICTTIKQIAPYDVNVLIEGESGTGKELCAKALHYNSLRQDAPFVAENCGALPDELLESELFGHKKGAFTGAIEDRIGLFESAQGGTIFLDEIGDTSPAFQLKLLRVLQEKEIRPLGINQKHPIDVRIVAATNRNLKKDVISGKFREDLYYRLTTFTIHLPPLRSRLADIPYIATYILNKAQIEFGKQVDGFTSEAILCLQKYQWPGNIRELENEIKRMLVLARGKKIGAELISPHILQAIPTEMKQDMLLYTEQSGSLKARLDSLETHIITETLIRNRWNKTKAAGELGLSRVGLRNKLERYNIQQEKEQAHPIKITKIN